MGDLPDTEGGQVAGESVASGGAGVVPSVDSGTRGGRGVGAMIDERLTPEVKAAKANTEVHLAALRDLSQYAQELVKLRRDVDALLLQQKIDDGNRKAQEMVDRAKQATAPDNMNYIHGCSGGCGKLIRYDKQYCDSCVPESCKARDALVEAAVTVAEMRTNSACRFSFEDYKKAYALLECASQVYLKEMHRRVLGGE